MTDIVHGSSLMVGFYWYQTQEGRDVYFYLDPYCHCMTSGNRRIRIGFIGTWIVVDERFSNETINRVTRTSSTYPYNPDQWRNEDWQRFNKNNRREDNSDFEELFRQTNSYYGKCRDYGKSMAISSNGEYLVLGVTTFDYSAVPNTDYRGCIVLYRYFEQDDLEDSYFLPSGYTAPLGFTVPSFIQQTNAYYTSDNTVNDYFADSVAINRDAGVMDIYENLLPITIAGGAPRKTIDGAVNKGAVYIYMPLSRSRDGGNNWDNHTAQIKASDGVANDKFGSSCALNNDGTTIVIGASGRSSRRGGVYTYDLIDSVWTQRGVVLTASDSNVNYDFGNSIALSSDGNVLCVGSISHQMVYVYDRSGNSWTERFRIVPVCETFYFGKVISMNPEATMLCIDSSNVTWHVHLSPIPVAETMITFCPPEYITSELNFDIITYEFTLNGIKISDSLLDIPVNLSASCDDIEIDTHPLIPEVFLYFSGKYNENPMAGDYSQDPLIISLKDVIPNNSKGISVCVSRDGLLRAVGSPGESTNGRLHLFNYDEMLIPLHTFWNNDVSVGGEFGASVSMNLDGTVIVIGAPISNNGEVYIYTLLNSEWNFVRLTGTQGEEFGRSVSINSNGDSLIIGSPKYNRGTIQDVGKVDYYKLINNTWNLIQTIQPPDISENANFGCSVSLNNSGNVMAIGSFGWSAWKQNRGCVYIYDLIDGIWIKRYDILYIPDAQENDRFGFAVTLNGSGNILASSAINYTNSHINQGAIYVFDWTGIRWYQRTGVITDERPSQDAYFGYALAYNIDGTFLVIGTYGV